MKFYMIPGYKDINNFHTKHYFTC